MVAPGQDKLDDTEIAARLNDGRILSAEKRVPSFRYRELLDKYLAADGDIPKAAKEQFETERLRVVIRVFSQTHALFATCNNADSEIVRVGFKPTTANIDEAGQLTMAALANVMTSFAILLALSLFGDPRQLLPLFLSGRANEFRENAELSVLALLEEKDYEILRLEFQYRMAPAISEWISKFFYKGLLKNHPTALVDGKYRQIAREISKNDYKRVGPNGDGSKYWMIDVVHGISRAPLNSHSLHNYANAERIAKLVDQTLAKRVEPSKITILAYYTGQIPLVGYKVEATAQANGRSWTLSAGFQISSVDSFQGEENEFVFIDIVVAHAHARKAVADDEESEDDDGSEGFVSTGKITAHVKSANRLCCALTRGRSCVVVVCQLAALMGTSKRTQQKAAAAVRAMGKNFLDRKLVYHDYDSIDTSPVGESMRKDWDKDRLAGEVRMAAADNLAFLQSQTEKVKGTRYIEDYKDNRAKAYRTASRRTTRPNQPGATAKDADAFDIQIGRTGPALLTQAGAIPVAFGTPSQRGKRMRRGSQGRTRLSKSLRLRLQRTRTRERGRGRRRAQGVPVGQKTAEEPADGQDKGKGKEVDTSEKIEEN